MDDRHLTFIIVPHGELETRTFQISYRRLKLLLGLAATVLLVVCVFLALWFPALTQAARVPALERELAELEQERARVAELAQTLAEVEAQYERVREMLGADAAVNGEEPLLPPLREVRSAGAAPGRTPGQIDTVLSTWPLAGQAYVTRGTERAGHPGVDIAAPLNTEVKAAGAGTVAAAGVDEVYGNYVVLDHGGGLHTVYGHTARAYVKKGEKVRAGQVIALSGSSGRSTAPHLHFEVRLDGKPVDPLQHIRQR
jgi:lipoprotein NlpD